MQSKQLSRRERARGTKRPSNSNQVMWPKSGPSFLETYAFDTAFTNVTSAAGVVQGTLASIPSGSGAQARTGLRVTPVALQIRLSVSASKNSEVFGNPDYEVCRARVILIQSLYNTPAIADVLGGAVLSVLSPYNISYVGQGKEDAQIKVLWDKTYSFTYGASLSSADLIDIPASQMLTKQLRYASAATAEPVHGAFYLISITDQSLAANMPIVVSQPRLLFHDA